MQDSPIMLKMEKKFNQGGGRGGGGRGEEGKGEEETINVSEFPFCSRRNTSSSMQTKVD